MEGRGFTKYGYWRINWQQATRYFFFVFLLSKQPQAPEHPHHSHTTFENNRKYNCGDNEMEHKFWLQGQREKPRWREADTHTQSQHMLLPLSHTTIPKAQCLTPSGNIKQKTGAHRWSGPTKVSVQGTSQHQKVYKMINYARKLTNGVHALSQVVSHTGTKINCFNQQGVVYFLMRLQPVKQNGVGRQQQTSTSFNLSPKFCHIFLSCKISPYGLFSHKATTDTTHTHFARKQQSIDGRLQKAVYNRETATSASSSDSYWVTSLQDFKVMQLQSWARQSCTTTGIRTFRHPCKRFALSPTTAALTSDTPACIHLNSHSFREKTSITKLNWINNT